MGALKIHRQNRDDVTTQRVVNGFDEEAITWFPVKREVARMSNQFDRW